MMIFIYSILYNKDYIYNQDTFILAHSPNITWLQA